MDFARLQLRCKNGHHLLVLLNAAESGKFTAFNADFPVVFGAGGIENLDGPVGIGLIQTIFDLLYCHRRENYQTPPRGASANSR